MFLAFLLFICQESLFRMQRKRGVADGEGNKKRSSDYEDATPDMNFCFGLVYKDCL